MSSSMLALPLRSVDRCALQTVDDEHTTTKNELSDTAHAGSHHRLATVNIKSRNEIYIIARAATPHLNYIGGWFPG